MKIIIDVGSCFNEVDHLSNIISNKHLLHLTKQNNYVVCCKVEEYKDIRNIEELVNICQFLGFSTSNKFKTYANYIHNVKLNSYAKWTIY